MFEVYCDMFPDCGTGCAVIYEDDDVDNKVDIVDGEDGVDSVDGEDGVDGSAMLLPNKKNFCWLNLCDFMYFFFVLFFFFLNFLNFNT